jgi:hypothetical protein
MEQSAAEGIDLQACLSGFARFASRRWAGLPIVSNISNPVTLKFFNKYFVPEGHGRHGLSYDNPDISKESFGYRRRRGCRGA